VVYRSEPQQAEHYELSSESLVCESQTSMTVDCCDNASGEPETVAEVWTESPTATQLVEFVQERRASEFVGSRRFDGARTRCF
jgi:hypothetical protein